MSKAEKILEAIIDSLKEVKGITLFKPPTIASSIHKDSTIFGHLKPKKEDRQKGSPRFIKHGLAFRLATPE